MAAARGHRVFASDLNREDLRGLEVQGIRPLVLDVTDAGSIAQAVACVLEETDRVDALVNNAGYGQYGAVEDVSVEEWRRQFDVNFFGAIEVARAVLPSMRQARRGTIVNISSLTGKISIPFAAPYCASKHALEAMSDALRVEIAPFGIRVVVIQPGPITTRFGERARASVARFLATPGPYTLFYGHAKRAMDAAFQGGGLTAETVARIILKAIEAVRPRTRYRITRMVQAAIIVRQLLPDRLVDRLMKRMLELPDRV
jgi:NAD(P)-dependent dehydrogenase (short-subunit alcohol dehydrogenase family)